MSYEIDVATFGEPTIESIRAAVGDAALCERSPEDARFTRVIGKTWELSVDGPFEANVEDLHDDLAAVALSPGWLTQLRVAEDAPKKASALARRIAVHIAREYDGAALDLMSGDILFPRGGRRSLLRLPTKHELDVRLEWCADPGFLVGFGETFLEVLERHLPEALPTRFGTFEPPEFRLDGDRAQFVKLWDDPRAAQLWYAKKPALGGGLSHPYPGAPSQPGVKAAHLGLSLVADGLLASPAWRACVVGLFRQLAASLNAFFGRALVTRVAETATEIQEHLRPGLLGIGSRWLGLPRQAAWLTWLGPWYAGRVDLPETRCDGRRGLLVENDGNLDPDGRAMPQGVPESLYRVQVDNKDPGRELKKYASDFELAATLPDAAGLAMRAESGSRRTRS